MVFESSDLIKQAIEYHGNRIAVACSFGKDSMVVLEQALKVDPNIKVIFENTGVQFPETYKFRNYMVDEWNINLFESKPIKSFWECARCYGLPQCRKRGGKGSNAPKCCYYLKEKPGLLLERKIGVNAVITGLQSCESQSRKLLAMRYDSGNVPYTERDNIEFCSQRWFTRSTNKWNYHPIMNWSIEDVWVYTKKNDIPVSEVYTKWGGIYPRSGCLPCTAYKSWEDRLSVSHPKLYNYLKNFEDS
jgi:phosphoadenosine phosphosulfate reductase